MFFRRLLLGQRQTILRSTLHTRPGVSVNILRSAATAASEQLPRNPSDMMRAFVGTTAGAALFVVSGSILAWPLADAYFGPWLVLHGLRKTDVPKERSPKSESCLPEAILEGCVADEPKAFLASTVPREGRALERAALRAGRPVIYLPLGEATSPHNLFMAIEAGVYSKDRHGFVGVLTQSLAVWWLVIFDAASGGAQSDRNRAFHMAVALAHLRRSLTLLHSSGVCGGRRPLIVVDGFEEVSEAACLEADQASTQIRSMMLHFVAWCTAACFEEGLTDIAVLGMPQRNQAGWWQSKMHSSVVRPVADAREFRERLRSCLL